MERSTRFSIVEHALGDVMERLQELPPSPDVEELRGLARQFEAEMVLWEEHPPDEATRIALLKRVLDLNIEIIRAGSARPTETEPDDDDDRDDEFPKTV